MAQCCHAFATHAEDPLPCLVRAADLTLDEFIALSLGEATHLKGREEVQCGIQKRPAAFGNLGGTGKKDSFEDPGSPKRITEHLRKRLRSGAADSTELSSAARGSSSAARGSSSLNFDHPDCCARYTSSQCKRIGPYKYEVHRSGVEAVEGLHLCSRGCDPNKFLNPEMELNSCRPDYRVRTLKRVRGEDAQTDRTGACKKLLPQELLPFSDTPSIQQRQNASKGLPHFDGVKKPCDGKRPCNGTTCNSRRPFQWDLNLAFVSEPLDCISTGSNA